MQRVLFAWLPLLAGVLLLLRGYAALLGPNPRQYGGVGENKMLERSTASRKSVAGMVIAVATIMSLLLALMVVVLTFSVQIRVPVWVGYTMQGIVIVGGIALIVSVLMQLLRPFDSYVMKAIAAVYAIAAIAAWWFWPNWLTVDLLVPILALVAINFYLQMTLSFKIVAVLGAGMFLYDIINVYITGNMLKVADAAIGSGETSEDARLLPLMVIVPDGLSPDAGWVAALGLGDIAIPGLMIMIAAVLAYRHSAMKVLYGGLAGYAAGMIAVLGILMVTEHAQPALITLYPCVLIGILLAAKRQGLLHELFSMRHEVTEKRCDHRDEATEPA